MPAVIWPVIAVSMGMLLAFVGLVVALFAVVPRDRAAQIVQTMVESHAVGRGIALFLIVPTIAVLAALDKINGAAAIAALSAIAGYVLGGVGIEQAVR